MLIKRILKDCNEKYSSPKNRCYKCDHPSECPGNCNECLRQIHFDADKEDKRHSYNCRRLARYYVCKYAFKYTSEMIYALDGIDKLLRADNLNVLSIGCGPCTDLFAFDYLRESGKYRFNKLEYVGVEPLDAWREIQEQIQIQCCKTNMKTYFKHNRIQDFLPILTKDRYKSDVIIMNYFLSDFRKYGGENSVIDFLRKIVYYIVNVSPDAVIIINDINLDCSRGGGRDYFDTLFDILQMKGFKCVRRHFNNSNKPNHFDYGDEYSSNELIFTNELIFKYNYYEPYSSCSSAQIIIYKE